MYYGHMYHPENGVKEENDCNEEMRPYFCLTTMYDLAEQLDPLSCGHNGGLLSERMVIQRSYTVCLFIYPSLHPPPPTHTDAMNV